MFGFLKVKKHESRGFNYKPRYYDAEKEALASKIKALEKKEEAAEKETDVKQELVQLEKETIKTRLKEELRHAKDTSRRDMRGLWKGGNMRIFAILVGLLVFSYIVLQRFLPMFLKMLFPEENF
jgi:hypothetical protein